MSSPMFNFEAALFNYAGAVVNLEQAKAAIVTEATNLQSAIGPLLTPTVASISPDSGSAAGGTTVTITGAQLTGTTGVFFQDTTSHDLVEASSFTVVDDSTVTAVTAAGTGTSWVFVQTQWGGSSVSNDATFTWS